MEKYRDNTIIGIIDGPDLIWEGNDLVPQQIRHSCFLEVSFGEIRLGIDGMDSHLPHITSDQLAPGGISLFSELCRDFTGPKEGHDGVPVIDPSHDRLLLPHSVFIQRLWRMVDHGSGNPQQFALASDRKLRIGQNQIPGRLLPCGESSLEENPVPGSTALWS